MIHVVGLGGVGFWLAVALSRSVPHDNLLCWDADNLEGGHGHERLPFGPPRLYKTELLRGFVAVPMAGTAPTVEKRRFSGLRLVRRGDLVVDCTDMPLPRRRKVWNTARNRGAKMLRVSYDGRASTIVVSTGLPLIGRANGGYAEIPTLALSLAAGGLGAEAVLRYLREPKESFDIGISLGEVMANV